MKVNLEKVDLRSRSGFMPIEDEQGNVVGRFRYGDRRTVIMMGKYQGTFDTQQECQAFVEGVLPCSIT